MAIKFYLNNQEIKVETNAVYVATQDDTEDTGTFTLEWNSNEKAIAPMTPFRIEDTEHNDIWNFVVLADKVSIVKKTSPILYTHELVVSQNTHKLTKTIVRNSRFTQPVRKQQIGTTIFRGTQPGIYRSATQSWQFSNNLIVSQQPIYPETWEHIPDAQFDQYLKMQNENYIKEIKINKRTKIVNPILKLQTSTSYFKTIYDTGYGDVKIDYSNQSQWQDNLHRSIQIDIDKYEDGILTDTKTVTFSNGETYKNVNDPNFFKTSAKECLFKVKCHNTAYNLFNVPTGASEIVTAYNNKEYHPFLILCKASLEMTTYYYSLYDVLDILRKQTKKDYLGATHDSLFEMPTRQSDDGALLDSVIAPEFEFNQQDLFGCVNEVFNYIDAIATLDKDNVIGFEYFNEYGQDITYGLEFTDRISQLNEEHYTNHLGSIYQNGRTLDAIYYPSINSFVRIGSSSYGIPTNVDYQFNLPHKIDYIDEVYESSSHSGFTISVVEGVYWNSGNYGLIGGEYTITTFPDMLKPLPISEVIFEKSEYSLLKWENAQNSFPNQLNTLYYERGNNSIYFGAITDTSGMKTQTNVFKEAIRWAICLNYGVFTKYTVKYSSHAEYDFFPASIGLTSLNVYDLKLRVKYHAVYDGKAVATSRDAKYEGETIVNQSNANVELNRMGLNMQGLIARLGNETRSVSLDVSTYGSRIKKGSLWVDGDNNKWLANKVKTTFSVSSNNTITEVEFVKNFNMISQYTKLDQERRFYEISENLTSKGYETLVSYIYLSNYSRVPPGLNFAGVTIDFVESVFKGTLIDNTSTKYVDFALIVPYLFEDDDLDYDPLDLAKINNVESERAINGVYIPIHSYGFGNTLCFEMGYESPLNAGDRLTGSGTANDPLINRTTLYCDSLGFADKISFVGYSSHFDNAYLGENFPLLDTFDFLENLDFMFDIFGYKYYKRPNEILHLNFEVAFLPYNNQEIFIGEEFINNNAVVNNRSIGPKDLYLYVSTTNEDKYSFLDKKALGTSLGKATITYTGDNETGHITITAPGLVDAEGVAWCLADANKNIYISSNVLFGPANSILLYYFTSSNRI